MAFIAVTAIGLDGVPILEETLEAATAVSELRRRARMFFDEKLRLERQGPETRITVLQDDQALEDDYQLQGQTAQLTVALEEVQLTDEQINIRVSYLDKVGLLKDLKGQEKIFLASALIGKTLMGN